MKGEIIFETAGWEGTHTTHHSNTAQDNSGEEFKGHTEVVGVGKAKQSFRSARIYPKFE